MKHIIDGNNHAVHEMDVVIDGVNLKDGAGCGLVAAAGFAYIGDKIGDANLWVF